MSNEKKLVTIIVNASAHQWPKDEISYADVVTFAYPEYPQHPELTYSVTYKKGHGNSPEGILVPGGEVKTKEGMVFVVSSTGKS
jgi:hypothetical protein